MSKACFEHVGTACWTHCALSPTFLVSVARVTDGKCLLCENPAKFEVSPITAETQLQETFEGEFSLAEVNPKRKSE